MILRSPTEDENREIPLHVVLLEASYRRTRNPGLFCRFSLDTRFRGYDDTASLLVFIAHRVFSKEVPSWTRLALGCPCEVRELGGTNCFFLCWLRLAARVRLG